MEKVMIYPYSRAYEPYVRNAEVMGEYAVTALVSPRGWGYEGDVITDRRKREHVVSVEFAEKLEHCTCVWFVADGRLEIPRELLRDKLLEAVKHGKRILYTRYGDDDFEEMKRLIPAELYIEKKADPERLLTLSTDRIYDIDTPVIVVAGMGEDTEKLAVQLALRQKFLEKGYETVVVSSRRDGNWDDVYSMPEYMFDHSVGEADKIIRLNHYVKQIEAAKRPDLFILGVPGAVLPFDGIDHNGFGILAYEISFAVPCDASVMCMMYNPTFDGDYRQLAEDVEHRFGYPVVGIHMAAVVTDVQGFYEERKMSIVSIDRSVVDWKVAEIHEDTVWNILSEQGAERAVARLIDTLSE